MSVHIPSASNSNGYITSKEMLLTYIRNMSKADIRKLLSPVREGILTENTVLHMNTQNFSVDHVVVPITVAEFLKELNPRWIRWIHTAPGERDLEEGILPSHITFDHHGDNVSNEVIMSYIHNLDKHQKRSLLNLIREGILTDECFINVSTHQGPERLQVPMPRVVDMLRLAEIKELEFQKEKPTLLKIISMKHYSSACFENDYRADLQVRAITAARFTMPIWYTLMFSFMTFATFLSHIWSQVTNYGDMQDTLPASVPTIILVTSSILIGMLLYLNIYIVGFLCCCENNYGNQLVTKDLDYSTLYIHFCELNRFEVRIFLVKSIQFIMLWYTMLLAMFAHEHDLNIYPELTCVLTNGFGLMLFARIAEFFRRCRKTRNGTAIAAR